MAKRRVSNLLALAVLACLVERPMHPYEISTTMRTRGKEQSIKLNYGSLYSVVDSLAKHGLIEAWEQVREGRRPERTVYRITPAGKVEFEDWLAELLSTPVREYTSLEAALSLVAGIGPDEAARLLLERANRLRLEIGGIDAMLAVMREQSFPELFSVETEYRRAVLDAECAFVTDLATRIREDKIARSSWWRRVYELTETGLTFGEVLADPTKYLGDDADEIVPFLQGGS